MKFDVPFVHFRVNMKSDLDIDLLTQWVLANCGSVPALSLVKIHAMSAKTATNVPKIKHIYIDPYEI